MEKLNIDNQLKVFNDIGKQQKNNRLMVFASLAVVVLVTIGAMMYTYSVSESYKNNVYLLDNGQQLALNRVKDLKQSIEILSEGHLKNFHDLFFSIEPDFAFIKKNIEGKALYMIDHSGPKIYNQLMDDKYYQGIVYSNYSLQVEEDSIKVDYAQYPYEFRYFARQKILKDGDYSYRNLITKGYLSQVGITPNNLSGLRIDKFIVVDNSDITN